MVEVKDSYTPPPGEEESPDSNFDRQAYLKEIRGTILKNMGLPEHTKPDKVMRLLAIQEKIRENRDK